MPLSANQCLYYPGIEPPLPWLKRMLLFEESIARIVPGDVNHTDSDKLEQFLQDIDCELPQVPPANPRVSIDLDLVERIFRKEPSAVSTTLGVTIDENGSLAIEGTYFVHLSKIGNDFLKLARKYGHVVQPASHLVPQMTESGFVPLTALAADVAMTLVADRVAKDNGFRTLTDREGPFTFAELSGRDLRARLATQDMAFQVVNIAIPESIDALSPSQYLELRQSYSSLRGIFRSFLRAVVEDNCLADISDEKTYRERIRQVVDEIEKSIMAVKKSDVARTITKWSVGLVGTTCSIASAWIPVAGPVLGTVGGLVTLYELMQKEPAPLPNENCTRLLGSLRSDVYDALRFRQWME